MTSSANLMVGPDVGIFHLNGDNPFVQETAKEGLVGVAGWVFLDPDLLRDK